MQKMRQTLSGLRNSLVRSQVWRPAFTRALQKYPTLEMEVLQETMDGCEACRLSGRKSTRLAMFSGEPYDEVTFEVGTLNFQGSFRLNTHYHMQPSTAKETSDGNTSDGDPSGEASSNETEDADEQETNTDSDEVEDQKRFTIGRYCARRSEVFHELTHWEVRYDYLSLFLVPISLTYLSDYSFQRYIGRD